MISRLAAILLLGAGALVVNAAKYPLTESHSGSTFFDGWKFPVETYDNTTSGDVFWATAQNTSLLYVNDAGRAILKVDNTSTVVYNEKRYAPKLLSKTEYAPGTVFVMDAVHVPYGCSVWGAFWTQGTNWPYNGEIDIFEGVNQRTHNMMALHTGNTCTVDTSVSMTGNVTVEDCDQFTDSSSGCTIYDENTYSYGEAFSQAGGGVWVAEWTNEAIKIWFITRSNVPSNMTATASTFDTSGLGTPTAVYSSSTCDLESLFGSIDITLCGDFAGEASVLEATCPTLATDKTCYTTYVINDGSTTYANAYFELNYINIYTNNATTTSSSSTTTTAAGVSSKTSSSSSSAVKNSVDMMTPTKGLSFLAALGVIMGLIL
ncbi:uncharacterized protein L201_001517 [Kwoniella dendrophila CBS 6074]|uniref:GH16 domain-containing protein n=1 Tax=Kwoniella dendrophila CBS 6074 TaxID=1295534 RepID=A0AAX4JQ14_9TREE